MRIKKLLRAIEAESQPDRSDAADRAALGVEESLNAFNFLDSDSFWLLIGEWAGEPVGYATVVRIPKVDSRLGVLFVDEIYVLQAYRRKGIGTKLLEETHRIAQTLGYWRIRLLADPQDEAVRRFYNLSGFVDHGDGFFQKPVSG